MEFKKGDKVKYIGDVESFHGKIAVVKEVIRHNKLRIVFDNPLVNGVYRANTNNFVGVCGTFEKRIIKHKFIKWGDGIYSI